VCCNAKMDALPTGPRQSPLPSSHPSPSPTGQHSQQAKNTAMTDGDERATLPSPMTGRRCRAAVPQALAPRSRIPASAAHPRRSSGRPASAARSAASHGSPGSAGAGVPSSSRVSLGLSRWHFSHFWICGLRCDELCLRVEMPPCALCSPSLLNA